MAGIALEREAWRAEQIRSGSQAALRELGAAAPLTRQTTDEELARCATLMEAAGAQVSPRDFEFFHELGRRYGYGYLAAEPAFTQSLPRSIQVLADLQRDRSQRVFFGEDAVSLIEEPQPVKYPELLLPASTPLVERMDYFLMREQLASEHRPLERECAPRQPTARYAIDELAKLPPLPADAKLETFARYADLLDVAGAPIRLEDLYDYRNAVDSGRDGGLPEPGSFNRGIEALLDLHRPPAERMLLRKDVTTLE